MIEGLVAKVRAAIRDSEFLRSVASVRLDGGKEYALGGTPVRRLFPEEVARLESLGNTSDNWGQVWVAKGFDWRRVRGSEFHGTVVLGYFDAKVRVTGGAGGAELPAGVYNSTLVDCVVGHDALVRRVGLLANYVVGAGAILFDCGSVVCDAGTAFGNGVAVPVALESGGRDVAFYAELDVEVAAAVAGHRKDPAWLREYADLVAEYQTLATSAKGLVGPGASVLSTATLRNTFVGPYARVDGATHVLDSTLLSGREEPTTVASGACVTGSVLQWGSRVSTLAVVERSVLGEHSQVERHAKVTDSVVGPNCGLGAGEVTSSLLGPFVACHHQSLLISAFWPGGRGNIAYGANVGSNHTSRAPDQELRLGEGIFLGLGVNVKFPADFSRAPYSVVACGATLLPQKVTFPFALIAPPSAHHPGVSPAFNEIIPGWVLAENLFALRRNEAKYRTRNKARRARFDFRILRPDTVDLMRDARARLEAIREHKDFYTERDVEGLGKNVLLERHRLLAIDTYAFHIRCYALMGLLEQCLAHRSSGRVEDVLTVPSDDWRWEHQRQLLVGELELEDVTSGLQELPEVLEAVGRAVERAKAKDDERGARIIEDYQEAHAPAGQDEWVRRTWQEVRRLQAEVEKLLAELACRDEGQGRRSRRPLSPPKCLQVVRDRS